MYKVLLVDDERIIREGIAAVIDWESHGLLFMGAAQNGIEAYGMILENPPHIVITDIKMPVLDGLQLIEKVKAKFPEIAFVVLSGYGEFEFASKAMRYGVRHYLLKPCNEAEILEVLAEIRDEFLQKDKKSPGVNYESIAKKHSKLVRSVMKHVQENLANENLSLKWLAGEVLYINVGYLSKLFSKETGEKFTQYLTRMRMEKAKELIEKSDDDKIYEVAQRVGLGDNPQYFSQLFKKYTGLTPTEYKRQ